MIGIFCANCILTGYACYVLFLFEGSTDNVSVCSQPYQSVVAVKRINEQPTASRNGSTSKKHSLSCFGNSLPTASNA